MYHTVYELVVARGLFEVSVVKKKCCFQFSLIEREANVLLAMHKTDLPRYFTVIHIDH